jgi:hypothetical protein
MHIAAIMGNLIEGNYLHTPNIYKVYRSYRIYFHFI